MRFGWERCCLGMYDRLTYFDGRGQLVSLMRLRRAGVGQKDLSFDEEEGNAAEKTSSAIGAD